MFLLKQGMFIMLPQLKFKYDEQAAWTYKIPHCLIFSLLFFLWNMKPIIFPFF